MDDILLKTVVGSKAHGLDRPDSDTDYRGVYVTPTSEIVSLGFNYKGSHWFEGKEDNTTYEIGHFLLLATKCNPSILEVFVAPKVGEDVIIYPNVSCASINFTKELRELLPYVWNPQDAFNAFVGYGLNQRKKMLDNHLDRWVKYGVAYIRTLHNLIDLLSTETFSLYVSDPVRKELLLKVREGKVSVGEIINITNCLEATARDFLGACKHKPDIDRVNNYLLKVRKHFW